MWTKFKERVSGTLQHPGVKRAETYLSEFEEIIDRYIAEWTENPCTNQFAQMLVGLRVQYVLIDT
jgi:hypothetical protein